MRKGQRVRILRTGEMGTITDQILMNKNGRRSHYCQVRLDRQPDSDRWFMQDQLGSTKETVTINIRDDQNQELLLTLVHNHTKNRMTVTVDAVQPENLKEIRGLAAHFAVMFLENLKSTKQIEL